MLESLKDPATGKLKPAVVIGAGGVAVVGMFLLVGKGGGSSQAGGTPGVVSGGQSGDNTADLSDLQDAIIDLGTQIQGHANLPPSTPTTSPTPPTAAQLTARLGELVPAVKTLRKRYPEQADYYRKKNPIPSHETDAQRVSRLEDEFNFLRRK